MSSYKTPARVARILERENGGCYYCGKELSVKTICLDHVHPKSKGGKSNDSNLVASCVRCNTLKWDFPLEVFMERVRSKYKEATRSAEHFKRILDKAEKRGLK